MSRQSLSKNISQQNSSKSHQHQSTLQFSFQLLVISGKNPCMDDIKSSKNCVDSEIKIDKPISSQNKSNILKAIDIKFDIGQSASLQSHDTEKDQEIPKQLSRKLTKILTEQVEILRSKQQSSQKAKKSHNDCVASQRQITSVTDYRQQQQSEKKGKLVTSSLKKQHVNAFQFSQLQEKSHLNNLPEKQEESDDEMNNSVIQMGEGPQNIIEGLNFLQTQLSSDQSQHQSKKEDQQLPGQEEKIPILDPKTTQLNLNNQNIGQTDSGLKSLVPSRDRYLYQQESLKQNEQIFAWHFAEILFSYKERGKIIKAIKFSPQVKQIVLPMPPISNQFDQTRAGI